MGSFFVYNFAKKYWKLEKATALKNRFLNFYSSTIIGSDS